MVIFLFCPPFEFGKRSEVLVFGRAWKKVKSKGGGGYPENSVVVFHRGGAVVSWANGYLYPWNHQGHHRLKRNSFQLVVLEVRLL